MRLDDELKKGGIDIPKIKNPLRYADEVLKMDGFNFREKFNACRRAIEVMIAPIVAARYLAYGPGFDENLGVEIGKWAYPFLAIIPGLVVGAPWGAYSALKMRNVREERERTREATRLDKEMLGI